MTRTWRASRPRSDRQTFCSRTALLHASFLCTVGSDPDSFVRDHGRRRPGEAHREGCSTSSIGRSRSSTPSGRLEDDRRQACGDREAPSHPSRRGRSDAPATSTSLAQLTLPAFVAPRSNEALPEKSARFGKAVSAELVGVPPLRGPSLTRIHSRPTAGVEEQFIQKMSRHRSFTWLARAPSREAERHRRLVCSSGDPRGAIPLALLRARVVRLHQRSTRAPGGGSRRVADGSHPDDQQRAGRILPGGERVSQYRSGRNITYDQRRA
jgi:hypothetical protein